MRPTSEQRAADRPCAREVGRDFALALSRTRWGGRPRPDGRWRRGRSGHLLAAARRVAWRTLGVERIHLYQLHAPDAATPLATSVARRVARADGYCLVDWPLHC